MVTIKPKTWKNHEPRASIGMHKIKEDNSMEY